MLSVMFTTWNGRQSRAARLAHLPLAPRARPELVHARTVVLVEAGERVRRALARRAEKGANEPVAIERMQRKAVDVDAARGDHARSPPRPQSR